MPYEGEFGVAFEDSHKGHVVVELAIGFGSQCSIYYFDAMICMSDIIACLGLEFLASLAYFSPYGYDASYEEGLEEIGYNSCLSLPHMTHYRLPTFPHALVFAIVQACQPGTSTFLPFRRQYICQLSRCRNTGDQRWERTRL